MIDLILNVFVAGKSVMQMLLLESTQNDNRYSYIYGVTNKNTIHNYTSTMYSRCYRIEDIKYDKKTSVLTSKNITWKSNPRKSRVAKERVVLVRLVFVEYSAKPYPDITSRYWNCCQHDIFTCRQYWNIQADKVDNDWESPWEIAASFRAITPDRQFALASKWLSIISIYLHICEANRRFGN